MPRRPWRRQCAILFVFVLGCALAVSVALLGSASQGNGAVQTPPKSPPVVPTDRTTPLLAQMTKVQRARAKLYAEFKGRDRLLDKNFSTDRFVDFISFPRTRTVEAALTDLACTSTHVLLAQVQSVESHPTEDGTFIFSDYDVRVIEAFRGEARPGAGARGVATFTRPGGSIIVDALPVPVEAMVSTFPSLTNGDTYLLFGTYVAEAEAVRTADWQGQFRLVDQRVIPLVTFDAIGVTPDGIDLGRVQRALRSVSCR